MLQRTPAQAIEVEDGGSDRIPCLFAAEDHLVAPQGRRPRIAGVDVFEGEGVGVHDLQDGVDLAAILQLEIEVGRVLLEVDLVGSEVVPAAPVGPLHPFHEDPIVLGQLEVHVDPALHGRDPLSNKLVLF